jgi:hypothetical protein
MFQYAYGLAAAKRIGTELKLDLSWFEVNSAHRSYILDRFQIETPIASNKEIEYIKTRNGRNFIEYRWKLLRDSMARRHKKAVVKEDLSVFDSNLKLPYKDSYIEGYFSTEQFFSEYQQDVIKAFTFSVQPPENVKRIGAEINDQTVAFSIRRGDFLGNDLHNICSVEYFQRAVNKMKETLSEPNLLVFSDELDWVMSNLNFDVPHTFVDGVQDHMDHMRLMAMCRYHIIPNSTFSWWGAWLAQPKLVVAPDLWISDDEQVHQRAFGHWVETRHTVPESWLRIPANLGGETMM